MAVTLLQMARAIHRCFHSIRPIDKASQPFCCLISGSSNIEAISLYQQQVDASFKSNSLAIRNLRRQKINKRHVSQCFVEFWLPDSLLSTCREVVQLCCQVSQSSSSVDFYRSRIVRTRPSKHIEVKEPT